uniref:Uncharacterized protein n=1 Tax=Triticum urartu TaxID=4572 RepID=A0A8R7K3P6_TRIUA
MRDLVTVRVGDVLSQPLGFVAERIKRAVARVDNAFVCSVIDYLELESIGPPFVSSVWPWLLAFGRWPRGFSNRRVLSASGSCTSRRWSPSSWRRTATFRATMGF